MIPAKININFIQITTDFSGIITSIDAGEFAKKEFFVTTTIFDTCPFLEGTLEGLIIAESVLLEGMVIVSDNVEYNVDIELLKNENSVEVLILNRTNVYKIVDQLNQNRNDLFFVKREIAEKNKELDRLRKIADKANEEKSRFLAMMSHEIRNPLNAILGYAEMIAAETLNKNVEKYIKHLSYSGKNLKVIVDDILDLSRIEAGKLVLVNEEMSIENIYQNCEDTYKNQQKNTDVKLVFSVDKEIPKTILGDSVRLHQILSNLIGNAIKFTQQGSVTISATPVLTSNKEYVNILFTVTDTGRGMSKEQAVKIFEEYQQNKISDNRVHGGAGLGLAIVNRLVTAMNGKINLESELNKGTSFFIEIPFKKIEDKKLKNIAVSKTECSIKNKRILVADDDLLNQTIVAHYLKKQQANSTIVSDGLEALEKIESEVFDVILLDINMPNMTGEELVTKNKSFLKFNSTTPILALTANATKEDIKRYKKAGFLDVISKPFTSKKFVEKICSVLFS